MIAAWNPDATASSQAANATTVLPEPTSPCSSRCIGCGSARSRAISAIARRCAPVGENGSAPRKRVSALSGALGRGQRQARLAPRRAAPARQPELQEEELVEHQAPLRRRGALVERAHRRGRQLGRRQVQRARAPPPASRARSALGDGARHAVGHLAGEALGDHAAQLLDGARRHALDLGVAHAHARRGALAVVGRGSRGGSSRARPCDRAPRPRRGSARRRRSAAACRRRSGTSARRARRRRRRRR